MERVNIFGTYFCVPKGYRVGKGYTLECVIPPEAKKTIPKQRIREMIRHDVEALYNELGDDFSEEKFRDWVVRNPPKRS
jgi:hypothetical protein